MDQTIQAASAVQDVPEPEVVVREPSVLARFMFELDEQWPILKFLGFGFYYAWIWLCYNSTVLLGPDTGAHGASAVFSLYLSSTTALALTLIAASFAVRFSSGLVERRLPLVAFGALATVGTAVAGLTSSWGPYHPAFIGAGVLTGFGTAWVALRLGAVYASVPARKATLYTTASFVFACLLYFLAMGLPRPLGLVVMAGYPLLAALVTMTTPEEPVLQQERPRRVSGLPRGFFLRLVLAIGVFSTVVGVTRGFSTLTQSVVTLNSEGAIIVFGTACVALLLYMLVSFLGANFDIGRLYYPAIILLVAGISVMPVVGAGAFEGRFVGVAYACFIMMVWCLLAHVAHWSGLAPVRVFGLGRGASALGTSVGWLLGSGLMRGQSGDETLLVGVSIVMVIALLIVSMLVFNDRMVGMALKAVDGEGDESAQLRRSGPAGVGERSAGSEREGADSIAVEREPDSGVGESRGGAFSKRCHAVANSYGLSPRERDVLFLLAKGRTIGFIADDLGVSFNTAKSHIRHVYVKAGVHTRQELIDLIENIET